MRQRWAGAADGRRRPRHSLCCCGCRAAMQPSLMALWTSRCTSSAACHVAAAHLGSCPLVGGRPQVAVGPHRSRARHRPRAAHRQQLVQGLQRKDDALFALKAAGGAGAGKGGAACEDLARPEDRFMAIARYRQHVWACGKHNPYQLQA
jgi:hypothetical protein